MYAIILFELLRCESCFDTEFGIGNDNNIHTVNKSENVLKTGCDGCVFSQLNTRKNKVLETYKRLKDISKVDSNTTKSLRHVSKNSWLRKNIDKGFKKSKKEFRLSKSNKSRKKSARKKYGSVIEDIKDEKDLFIDIKLMLFDIQSSSIVKIDKLVNDNKILVMRATNQFIDAHSNKDEYETENDAFKKEYTRRKINMAIDDLYTEKVKYVLSLHSDINILKDKELFVNKNMQDYMQNANEQLINNIANLIDQSEVIYDVELIVNEIRDYLAVEISNVLTIVESANKEYVEIILNLMENDDLPNPLSIMNIND